MVYATHARDSWSTLVTRGPPFEGPYIAAPVQGREPSAYGEASLAVYGTSRGVIFMRPSYFSDDRLSGLRRLRLCHSTCHM